MWAIFILNIERYFFHPASKLKTFNVVSVDVFFFCMKNLDMRKTTLIYMSIDTIIITAWKIINDKIFLNTIIYILILKSTSTPPYHFNSDISLILIRQFPGSSDMRIRWLQNSSESKNEDAESSYHVIGVCLPSQSAPTIRKKGPHTFAHRVHFSN